MTYDLKKASILVVDDMRPMLSLTASLLKIFGFSTIYKAQDADEGFALFCRHSPDIVLTDWLMEPYDGIELTRRIRNDPASPNRFVPVIMMTGYSHKIRVVQARDCGVTEFLVKPFRAKDLYARIEQLIEKPRRFVDAQEFFGPDRRRRRGDGYEGPRRRDGEDVEIDMIDRDRDTETVLRKLTEMAREVAGGDDDAPPPKKRKRTNP